MCVCVCAKKIKHKIQIGTQNIKNCLQSNTLQPDARTNQAEYIFN